jgi:hypothetical protein
MEGESVHVTLSVRGAKDPQAAARRITSLLKRSLYLIDADQAVFAAEIEIKVALPAPADYVVISLADGEWQRERDSNPRGPEPHVISGDAP